ncbi:MAG: tRNA (adenosine(37)-N6)-threonylcarbamoyltransferase complex dimerization subunit type 1 TsaB [Acidobacteriaceae bacterium]|jgi:tRNA threonylcarbamoyladenosine biosynthesis protein TsaB
MLILSIDTCGPLGTVALGRLESTSREGVEKLTILAQTDLPGKTWSAQLLPAIRELLATHNAPIADLAAIAVTTGPGSFTGIRIGLSTAKGLAEVHATPILAVSRLAILVHKANASAAALDASRGEFYFGNYSATPNEQLITRDQFTHPAALLGPKLAVCEESLLAVVPTATLVAPPTAADALRFALPRLHSRDFDNPITLDGNYLRRSDAEIFSKPKTASTAP